MGREGVECATDAVGWQMMDAYVKYERDERESLTGAAAPDFTLEG